jgi:hypothetical protein
MGAAFLSIVVTAFVGAAAWSLDLRSGGETAVQVPEASYDVSAVSAADLASASTEGIDPRLLSCAAPFLPEASQTPSENPDGDPQD